MVQRKFSYQKRYHNIDELMQLEGNHIMRFTKNGAIEICKIAMDYDILIWRIEGGIWRYPGFQACGDAICDGIDPPASRDEAIENNLFMLKFLTELQPPECDVYIFSVTNYQDTSEDVLYSGYYKKFMNS